MTFARLRAADWVAFIAALALMLVTALDWYSTPAGEEARRLESRPNPLGAIGGELGEERQEEARLSAERAERNAWQVSGAIDRVILAGLLATSALGVLAAFARAGGRRSRSALPPSGLAAAVGSATALLVLYRILQEPGLDEATVVKAGAPLALVVLGVLAYASAVAMRAEDTAPAGGTG